MLLLSHPLGFYKNIIKEIFAFVNILFRISECSALSIKAEAIMARFAYRNHNTALKSTSYGTVSNIPPEESDGRGLTFLGGCSIM